MLNGVANVWMPVEDLKERGVEFPAGISEHDWGRVTTFSDTEGNNIQLFEPPRG